MVLDECTGYNDNPQKMRDAMLRTNRWAERCIKSQHSKRLLFAIVQGVFSRELRIEAASMLRDMDFSAMPGSLSVGEPKELTWSIVDTTVEQLPEDKTALSYGCRFTRRPA
jgi:queuine tRNA-ribosyltransferase